jgi:hypothetical protein
VSHDIDFASDASTTICVVGGYPPCSEDMVMGVPSRFFSSLAVAVSSFALLTFGLSGTAMSRTEPPSDATVLPGITIQAPKPVARSQKRAGTRNAVTRTVSRGTSRTDRPTTAGEESVLEKLRRIERSVSSCDGGCASSLPSKGQPWVGCSESGWPMGSGTCRNGRKYTNYVQCTEEGYFLAWKPMEVWWYCSSLAFKN